MRAKRIEEIVVRDTAIIDGVHCLVTDCVDYEHYRKLPPAVELGGIRYGLTGWNSDSQRAHYQTNVILARAAN